MKMFGLKSRDCKRFWLSVKKSRACWTWTGCLDSKGYGRLFHRPRKYLKRSTGAHRISYFLAYGTFDKALFVCHKCDNPVCVNPKHLFLGTQKDNIRDCIKKGRFSFNNYRHTDQRGENSANAKLTEKQVIKIRKLYGTGKFTYLQLGKAFGIQLPGIAKIITRQRWKHI